jgi:DNA-binding NarL/FixJ family response regulator
MPAPVPIRILLVDDHEMMRKGIRSLLKDERGWEVCCEAADGKEAIQNALEAKPDLILMDISMPTMNGIEATRQIRRSLPHAKIIILTMHDSPQIAEQARSAGANACLLKSDSPEHLRRTIATVLKET